MPNVVEKAGNKPVQPFGKMIWLGKQVKGAFPVTQQVSTGIYSRETHSRTCGNVYNSIVIVTKTGQLNCSSTVQWINFDIFP
jgi:hypothetical protein